MVECGTQSSLFFSAGAPLPTLTPHGRVLLLHR